MSFVHDMTVPNALAHELFELRASAAPDATALRFQRERLSYRDLNARSNQLARYLGNRGVGAEARVVVCVEPSVDLLVAVLAILKLGAVYVPLDPSYPAARIRAMLDDLQPAVLLTHAALREKLAEFAANTCELDALGEELLALPDGNLGLALEPQSTAYIYYTSGTTGTPKGVMASHSNLAYYLGTAQRRYAFDSADVGLALARFGFSISMFELLSPLIAGGTLVLLERAQVLDFAQLCTALREATFFHAGPSLLRGLLRHVGKHVPDASLFDGIRHASSGGDMVPVEVLEGLRRVFRRAEVFVIYGCSEISCMGTTYPVPRDIPLTRSYVGTPFDGTTVRVVDEELRDVPVGVVGEVLFAGPGVVKGYLNRPELSAEKFRVLGEQRFYRTGDRGRQDGEGRLELVGRADFQLKLGGIRIEPGEIEHHLRRAPGVQNGVVSARELGGEKQLIAYVVLEDVAAGDAQSRAWAIRSYLLQQLPDYMVPNVYVELPVLPLNHNAKLDRNALPPPPDVPVRIESGIEHALETPMEQRLAALWRAVLHVDRVSRSDNFFDLGGSSLSALQLISLLDRELGVVLDGLTVLRESLELQARLCEPGHQNGTCAHVPAATPPERIESFYFGPADALYGVLHGAGGSAETAVLVCAPTGHEYLRSHFILQRLARKLAASGIPALRFDYYGCGDSQGQMADATLTRWQQDIVTARQELARRTGAKSILAVGARLGATLLVGAAARLQLSKLVLWDSITDGAQYRAQLLQAQRRYARSLPGSRWRAHFSSRRGATELLGATYSHDALAELSRFQPRDTHGLSIPVQTLRTGSPWLALPELEEMLPDTGISAALSELVRRAP